MLSYIIQLLSGYFGWVGELIGFLLLGFHIWMLIDAIRRGEIIWAIFIFFFPVINDLLYFFLVYRVASGGALAGFELPGAADRRRIKSLLADIHHLDKPHHHLQLADIYFSQGKLDKAEESYRAAYQRDPNDEDIRAHLGNCLVRRNKPQEALPLLEGVCASNPKHDYGYTLMTLAETQAAMGQTDRALATWRQVLALYSYPRARVQFAELLIQKKEYDEARKNLEEVINDAPYAAKFSRKREAVWFSRAKSLLRSVPK
ncbi:MAG TPA: tetratricopeptide repeat protein [Candidatus Methylacidiphilales bacterium]|nr:tetratricopeptide repeat protein [Candidatus Methylacidiphilales bacterium]